MKKISIFSLLIIVVIIASSCSNNNFEESSTVRNYDGINVTIKQNSAFERELKITYEIKELTSSQKEKIQKMFPGITFPEKGFARFLSKTQENNSVKFDADSLFKKADEIIRDLELIKNDNVSFFKEVNPSDGTEEITGISLQVVHSYKDIITAGYGVLIIEISYDYVTRFEFLNSSYKYIETGKTLELLPVEQLVEKYFERIQNLATYSCDKFQDMLCVPAYYLKDEKFIPVWMIGEGEQFTNAGYIDAITGDIYEWPYR